MSRLLLLAFGLPSLAIALTACPGVDQLPGESQNAVQLSLSPSSLKLDAGQSASVNVSIQRSSNVNREVRLVLTDLPQGVSAPAVIVPAGSDHVTITLSATDQARTEQASTVTVTARSDASATSTPLYVAVAKSSLGAQVNASFSNGDSNADTSPLTMTSAYANFKGSLCQVTISGPGRGIYVCLAAGFKTQKTYQLVRPEYVGAPGTASVTYFETGTGASQGHNPRAWDSSDGTLSIDAISSQGLELHTQGAIMVPADGFAGNLATGHFLLEFNASIEDVSNL